MRKANKFSDSEVLNQGLDYRTKGDNKQLHQILSSEQAHFCAYMDKRLETGYKGEIEHFNPHLKGTSEDNYYNWFVCHGDWNRRKGSQPKWDKHQPVLSPFAEDFEKRIRCECESMLYVNDEGDLEAENLRKYLMLNDHGLTKERLACVTRIQNLKDSIAPQDLKDFLSDEENQGFIQFPRFLNEIYGISAEVQ
jgi:hypothetical protein